MMFSHYVMAWFLEWSDPITDGESPTLLRAVKMNLKLQAPQLF